MKRPLSKLKSKRVQSKRALPAAMAAGAALGAAAVKLGPGALRVAGERLRLALEKRAP